MGSNLHTPNTGVYTRYAQEEIETGGVLTSEEIVEDCVCVVKPCLGSGCMLYCRATSQRRQQPTEPILIHVRRMHAPVICTVGLEGFRVHAAGP